MRAVQLADAVEKVLANAAKLKSSSGANEANTKVLLIEPLLTALGWDTGDLDAVEREYRVYDNTSLDYALKIDGKPRLFVEAKGIGKNLDNQQFIAQTVNYANNEGVLWCVLTNGLVYRVYKTNEPVPMEQKLLFEVDLGAEGAATAADMAKSLELIARQSMLTDALEHWGDRVFTDGRVRKGLGQLAAQPTAKFLKELNQLLGKPEISEAKLRDSLARVMDAKSLVVPKSSDVVAPAHKPKPPTGTPPGGGKEYPLEHHLAAKPAAILDSFEQLDQFGRELGADVTRRIRKQYVGYFAGKKSFFTIEVQRQRLLLYLNLDPKTTKPWDESTMRDVTKIGHFGLGNTEYSVKQTTDLDGARTLIKKAYAATSA
jgi:predicted transport protein